MKKQNQKSPPKSPLSLKDLQEAFKAIESTEIHKFSRCEIDGDMVNLFNERDKIVGWVPLKQYKTWSK